ncbi:MAG: TonB-dependent receptor plug domain-containing protein [Gemmatimonadota bacterium]
MKGSKAGRALAGVAMAAALAGIASPSPAQEPGTDNQAKRLETIVVTATRMEEKVSEQASDVSVVTRDDIDLRSPAVAGDVLRDLPGVTVQRNGSAGNLENIRIRGALSSHTLVMIDGFPVNSPTLGSFDVGSLPLDGFERVEVVRGAQSALYGSSAIGGVVNFIPRKGEAGRGLGAGVAGGSFDSLRWTGTAQAGTNGTSVFLGGGGWQSDGILRNDDVDLVSFLGSAEIGAGAAGRIHGILLATDEDKGIPIDFNTPRDANHRRTRRGFMGGARWEKDVSRRAGVTASWSTFQEFFHETDPADPGGDLFGYVSDDVTRTRKDVVRLQGRYSPVPQATTLLGLEYGRDRAVDAFRSSFSDTDLAASIYDRSLFVQEELRAGTRAGISLGARWDRNSSAGGTEFNPKAAAYYDVAPIGTRVRGAVGRGFRVATPLERFDPFVGKPGLSPEVAVSYEAGADVTIRKHVATASVTYFYQDFKDLIVFDPAVNPPNGQLANVARAFSRGAEAEATWRPVPEAAAILTYTFTDSWDAQHRRPIIAIPRHRGVASLVLLPVPGFQGRIEWRIESDQVDSHPYLFGEQRRPGFAVVDAYARYAWAPAEAAVREIALTGKIQNLLDRAYEERRGFPAPGVNVLVGAEVRL